LTSIRAPQPFFGRVVEAGSHAHCIELVLSGEIDAAAIDSTVLDLAREQNPHLSSHIRVVEILGPSPIPPLTLTRSVDPALETKLCDTILSMHTDPAGQEVLLRGKISRFQHVEDSDYDSIRQMHTAAQGISW
jgi:phosphonate transport system substrate-binding protein